MATDRKVEALKAVGLFAGCTQNELRFVARPCTRSDVEQGSVLTTQGSWGDQCFVIAAGEAEVTIDGRAVATVGTGDCVGEMSLIDGGRRTATVTALTPMTVCLLSRAEFWSLLDPMSSAARSW
jgi:CRP-like cAMP-binding protein